MTQQASVIADGRLEAAVEAAKRYARLVYYHDNLPKPQYGHHPYNAWWMYCQQFSGYSRAATILSIIRHSFGLEYRRLVTERREGNVQGKSPAPASGRWHQP